VVLALRLGIGRAAVVRATAEVVSAAVALRHAPDLRPNRAVVTTMGWLSGRSHPKDAWAAGFSAMDAARELDDPRDAAMARATARLAFACDEEADDVFYAHRGYAASAADEASRVLGGTEVGADRFRDEIPLAAVLEAFAVLPRQPTPGAASASLDMGTAPTQP